MPRVNLGTRAEREASKKIFISSIKKYQILSGHELDIHKYMGICQKTWYTRLKHPEQITIREAKCISDTIGYPLDDMIKCLEKCV